MLAAHQLRLSFAIVAILLLIFLGNFTRLRAQDLPPKCNLEALNKTRDGPGALCSVIKNETLSSVELNDCVKFNEKPGVNFTSCVLLLTQEPDYCQLKLEIKHLITYVSLPPSQCTANGGTTNASITFMSVDIKAHHENANKLFESYPSNLQVVDLTFNDVTTHLQFDSFNFAEFQFGVANRVVNLKFVEMKFETKFPRVSDNLETIGVYNASALSIPKNSFRLNKPVLRKVELVDFYLKKEIEEHAFAIAAGNDCHKQEERKVEIIMRNMQLKPETIKSELIRDYWGAAQCVAPLKLNINITGNLYDRTIPEEVYKTILNSTLSRESTTLGLEFDNIDCCFRTNTWLFELMFKRPNRTRGITITCEDLGIPVTNIKNETHLNQVCYQRNVLPIYIIAIVSVLLLALLLGVFSFVCIYHILPTKNQEIMLKNRSSAATISRNDSAEDPTTRASSSAVGARSTKTETGATNLPLLSNSTIVHNRHKAQKAAASALAKKTTLGKEFQATSNNQSLGPSETHRSSRQHHHGTKSPKSPKSPKSSLLKASDGSGGGSGQQAEKRALNLERLVVKLPGYKNREKKHQQQQRKKKRKRASDEKLPHIISKDPTALKKRKSGEKSPARSPAKSPKKGSASSDPANAIKSPFSPPIKPPAKPVVLPNGINQSSAATANSEGPPPPTKAPEFSTGFDPQPARASDKEASAKRGSEGGASDVSGMSSAFKTIN